jgi:hypothetical protein
LPFELRRIKAKFHKKTINNRWHYFLRPFLGSNALRFFASTTRISNMS